MCIFVVSTENKKFPSILIDNRDEILDRPTAAPHWWQDSNIYAPQDLGSSIKGTWIGVTKTGRFTVLVNAYEEKKGVAKLSRGEMAKLYLESTLPPHDWIVWSKETHVDFLRECGKFTLLVGESSSERNSSVHYEFISNYDTEVPEPDSTIALSNGSYKEEMWKKVKQARGMFDPSLKIDASDQLTSASLDSSSCTKTSKPPSGRKDLRNYVFVPICTISGVRYGTRTQTVILIDNDANLTFTQRDTVDGSTSTETIKIAKSK